MKRKTSYRIRGKICKCSLVRSAVNIEPAIRNGYLSYPQERRLKEGRVGSWGVGGGIDGTKRLREGRVRRLFRSHELVHRSL